MIINIGLFKLFFFIGLFFFSCNIIMLTYFTNLKNICLIEED